jgi:phospholipid/cholesterol/gamma-HCH transport system substrate-binding protein/paraquat-inducible protein B
VSQQAHYIRVGAFVIGGIFATVAGALLFGGSRIFGDPPVVIETVFEESVQGLEVGSPVKLNGVPLGTVKWIGFVGDAYVVTGPKALEESRRALVRMEVTSRGVERAPSEQAMNIMTLVERGMRIRLTPLGITGTSFLQAEFLDLAKNPPMQISFTPREIYVPSAPSTINQLSSAAERLMTRIDKLDVEELLTNFDKVLVSVNDAIGQADVGGASKSVVEVLADLQKTSAAARTAIGAADLGGTSAEARRSIAELTATLARLQRMADASGDDLAVTLDNLRAASENLRDMAETARAYPSFLLFGQPPTPVEEDAK